MCGELETSFHNPCFLAGCGGATEPQPDEAQFKDREPSKEAVNYDCLLAISNGAFKWGYRLKRGPHQPKPLRSSVHSLGEIY